MSLLLSKDGSCSDVSAEYKANNTSLPHDENEAEVRSKNRRNPLVSVKQSKVSFSPNISINVSSPDDKGDMDRLAFAQESCKSYNVILVGESVLDRRFTSHMLPWIIAEVVRKKSISLEISLQLTDNSFRVSEPNVNEVLFEHKLKNVCKFSKTLYDHSCFMYLTRESVEEPYKCYVYKAESENVVIELFSKMKEVTKEIIQQQQNSGLLTENNEGLSKSVKYTMQDVQQFEVLYIGKIKVSHKRAPPTFIDDAVEKFKLYEIEKGKHPRERHGSGASITSLPGNIEQKVNVQENNLKHQLDCMESTESLSSGSDASLCLSISRSESSDVFPPSSASDKETNDTPAYNRMRSLSGDNVLCKTVNSTTLNGNSSDNEVRRPRGETWPTAPTLSRQQNRTMLFLIGKSEVCMISPDKKSALLTKSFRDISHCSQGIRHSDHFGFICRETCLEGYISYIFKCQSETVVDDIMLTLKQAFKYAHLQHQQQTNKSGPYVICNTCPMHWLHKVCIEIDGLNPERTNAVLMKKLEKLSEVDQNDILAKLNETEINSKQEKCEVLMIILMAMCRNKQMRHKHCNLTDNTKPEHKPSEKVRGTAFDLDLLQFQNSVEIINNPTLLESLIESLIFIKDSFHLGERRSSTFDNLKKKAKKSLTSSFENMLKRRSKEDVRSSPEKEVEHEILHKKPLPHWKSFDDSRLASIAMQKTSLQGSIKPINENETNSQNQAHTSVTRCRSSTIATVGDGPKEIEQRNENSTTPISPFMNMFMKVGNQVKSPMMDTNLITPKKGSWRQAIFNRVVTPVKTDGNLQDVPESPESRANNSARPPLTKENIRALWRKIIHQQITLIRMEKENKKLQAHQDAYSNKRIKLDYEEITPCLKDVTKVWEGILKSDCLKIFPKNDLLKSVKDGVPRIKRGDIWMFLSKQSAMRNPNAFVNDFDIDIPYSDLLKDLTSHQHAILIDLGRTFPSHPYYSRSLGPGQLGLFNLLKAYSLLDKDVGYCQGLSFVAGVLLLHMEEEDSFNMMKHLMFRIGIRRQYKPDMVALQVQMYQLSRLIHDHHRDLYEHFEMHEIAPTLYAAPWFLTLFASQFPLGFVSRLFDLLLLQDFEVIFKVALILLGNHKELIMQCNGFEPIMEFLKTTLPSLGIIQMERVFNQVFTLDISKQLHAFEVEYHVLQEEMILSPQKTEVAYQNLRRQNMELVEQLQVAHTNIHNLEHSIGSYQDTINRLQAQVKALDLEKSTLQRALVKLEHTPISGSNSTQYINEIINDNKFTSTKSTHYQDKNLNNTDFLSNRQPSNDSSSFDEEDKEVAILNSGSTNSISSKQHASTDSPEVDK